jgi:hypothetical protein
MAQASGESWAMPYKSRLSIISRSAKANATDLRTGVAVAESGIYRVFHPEHRLPQEVTLLQGHNFPRCSRCAEPALYELVRSAPAGVPSHRTTFQVDLYELPELETDSQIAS